MDLNRPRHSGPPRSGEPGVDAAEQPTLRRKLRRQQVLDFFRKLPAIRVGMEACGGAHHWAREIGALGHEVVLMPPQRVKPHVARNKNDPADAEATCEAMSRPRQRHCNVVFLFGTRVAEAILAAVMCNRDNMPDI